MPASAEDLSRDRKRWPGGIAVGVLAAVVTAGGIQTVTTEDAPAPPAAPPAQERPDEALKRRLFEPDIARKDDPWSAICEHRIGEKRSAATPCGAPGDYRAMLALVPDPETTALALFFDRAIESIQRAAEDSGHTFDRFWFPWRPARAAEEADPVKARERLADRNERLRNPGVLIFRAHENGGKPLVIFLVSETPTAGPNREAYTRALAMLRAIAVAEDAANIRILGPTFSGSLKQLIPLTDPSFRLISGSVTDKRSIDEFGRQRWLKTTVHSDQAARQAFWRYLRRSTDGGIRIAVLSEDETAYGEAGTIERLPEGLGGFHVIPIRFPRDIATLRNAYQDETSQQGLPARIRNWRQLPTILREETRRLDSVPSFSRIQTPLSQESTMAWLAASLRRQRVKFLEISATDVLDMLFLSRFLRTACPDIRQYTFEADLLFTRPTEDFRGLMAVTTYPMLFRNQEFLTPKEMRRILFPGRIAQGTYNACRAILGSKTEASWYGEMVEYSVPANFQRLSPPLWLTVVGSTGYWPVTYLEAADSMMLPAAPVALMWGPATEAPSRAWVMLFLLLTAFVLCFAGIVATAHLNLWTGGASRTPRPFPLIPYLFVAAPGRRGRRRLFYLLTAVMALAFAYIALTAPILTMRREGVISPGADKYSAIAALSLLFLAASAGWGVKQLWTRNAGCRPERWLLARITLGVLLLSAGLIWRFATSLMTGGPGSYFHAYRGVQLASGVSAELPLIALLAALFVWGVTQLRRVHFWEERRPATPVLSGVLFERLMPVKRRLDRGLESVVYSAPLLLLILIVMSVVCWILQPIPHLQMLENWQFERTYFMLLYLVVFSVASGCARVAYCWIWFRRYLELLELHPLRYAISDLPRDYSWSPVWERGGLRRSHTLLGRSIETLRKRASRMPEPRVEEIEQRAATLIAETTNGAPTAHEPFREVQRSLTAVATTLTGELEASFWNRGTSESLEQLSSKKGRRGVWPEAAIERSEHWLLADEFVALRFVHYIRYVLLQLRNLLTYIPVAFVLLVLSLNCYPFQSRGVILWSLTGFFAILTVAVVTVLSQMERDPILSRITDTEAGALSRAFFVRVAAYVAAPVIALLASIFPSIGDFLFSWVQPTLQALR